MRLTYAEWNLNQAANRFGKNVIPDFVFEEIKRQDKDVVVLVEYCDTCSNSIEFKKRLERIGYDVKVNDQNSRMRQNDVLIAWRREIFADEDVFEPLAEEDYPEMLAVKMRERISNTSFVVVGVRIRLCDGISSEMALSKRSKQLDQMLQSVYKKFGKDEILICLGDFNNFRTDFENCGGKPFVKWWSLPKIDNIILPYGLIRVTPASGSSIKQENSPFKFKEDHLLCSRLKVKPEENLYSRDFTERNKEIYLFGKDFCVYNSQIRKTTWEIPFGSGIPDHAILCGAVNIHEEITKEELVLGNYFANGGETYTREELILRLLRDTGLEQQEAENLIDRAVAKNWIHDTGNCYVK